MINNSQSQKQPQSKKKIRKSTVAIIVLMVILLAMIGFLVFTYQQHQQSMAAARQEAAKAADVTVTVERGDLTETIDDLTGTLRSKQSISLKWAAPGTVETVNVIVGDKVHKGDVLASLSSGSISSTIIDAAVTKEKKQKELDDLFTSDLILATAYSKMITAKKAVETAQTAIDNLFISRSKETERQTYYQDLLNAQSDYDTALAEFNQLKDRPVDDFDRQMAVAMLEGAKSAVGSAESTYNWYSGEVDQMDLKAAEAALKLRQAEYQDAVRAYEKIQNGPTAESVAALTAEINAAEATMKTAQIIAPIDGVITEVKAQPLDVIQANVSGGVVEMLAVRMDDLSSYYVDVSIHEKQINNVALGQTVSLKFDAVPLLKISGTISNISNVGTVTNNVVTYPVTVRLDETSAAIKPGMVASLEIITEVYQNILIVPATAVAVNEAGESTVAVKNEDGTFTDVVVTTGFSDGTKTEISGTSIEEGTLVRAVNLTMPFGSFGMGMPMPNPESGLYVSVDVADEPAE